MPDEAQHSDDLPLFEKLEGLSEQQLKGLYDDAAVARKHSYASFYLDEIRRRESGVREKQMRNFTFVIAGLTVVIAAASLYAAIWG
jgi:hypothetical protein